MKKRTIDEMIETGASWEQIRNRVNELQREQEEKKAAEAAAKMRQANKAQEAKVARERFINAFLDWVVAEGVIPSEDREVFGEMIGETCDNLMAEMKQVMVLKTMFGKIFK